MMRSRSRNPAAAVGAVAAVVPFAVAIRRSLVNYSIHCSLPAGRRTGIHAADNRRILTFLLPSTLQQLKREIRRRETPAENVDLGELLSLLPALPLARWQSGHAAACKAVYAGSIPTLASRSRAVASFSPRPCLHDAHNALKELGVQPRPWASRRHQPTLGNTS